MRWLLLLFCVLTSLPALAADLPDVLFSAVEGKQVELTREDGFSLVGTLMGFSDTDLVLQTEDGSMKVVKRVDIAKVREVEVNEAPAAPQRTDLLADDPEPAIAPSPRAVEAELAQEEAFENGDFERSARRMDTLRRAHGWMGWAGVGAFSVGTLATGLTCLDGWCQWGFSYAGMSMAGVFAGLGWNASSYRSAASMLRKGQAEKARLMLRKQGINNLIWGGTMMGAGALGVLIFTSVGYEVSEFFGAWMGGLSAMVATTGLARLAYSSWMAILASRMVKVPELALVPSISPNGGGLALVGRF